MSEEIGKHKGAVETLLHEQKELSRLLQIVQSQLERRLKALEEAGVDTDQFIEDFQTQSQQRQQQSQKNRKSQQRRGSSREQNPQRSQNSGRDKQKSSRSQQNSSSSDDEKDMEDYFEDDEEDGFGNRDFSPR